ncbi:MAG: chitobiase/beta-hexosaminidase C-terminal domain-containing protein [Lachnospiraceae bacterium]|nr:chitobiase/beta-hexosaminidase C-terminal domain-containing protein [Lachnospiraceae bacterium]
MKCSKCGAQCNDNLAFCLECGNPLQLMADFNLIEKELANSIGEFMDEMEEEKEQDIDFDGDNMKTIDVPLDEINMGLKVVDINRNMPKSDIDIDDDFLFDEDDEEEDIQTVYVPKKNRNNKRNSKKNNKKKYIIIASIVAVLVSIIAIVLVFVLGGDKNKVPAVKDFAYYYETADEDMKDNKTDSALDNALLALEKASDNEEIVKVRLLIKSIYEEQKYTGEYYIENLEELFKLGENSKENATILLSYYAKKNNIAGLINLFDIVSEEEAKNILGEQFVEKPEINLPAGEYKNVINIEISAVKDATIYYAVAKENEELKYEEYKRPVEIRDLGSVTLVTYAVTAEGNVSYKASCTYNIVEGQNEGPAVTPEAGTYKEPTKITVSVPDGSKAYYTYDGSKPDKNSTEYTEPVDMLKGVHTFKVVVIDKYGNSSEVTSVQYNLKLSRNETVATAKEKIWNQYLVNGFINAEGVTADGSVIEISYYNALDINNGEYYVYQMVAKSEDGTTTTAVTYCGVNTYDGTVVIGLIEDGESFLIPESE